MANTDLIKNKYKLEIIKYRRIWLTITSIILVPCILAIIYLVCTQANHAPLKLGIDFTGGSIMQFGIDEKFTTNDIAKMREDLVKNGIKNPTIQITKTPEAGAANLLSVRTTSLEGDKNKDKVSGITKTLKTNYNADLMQVNYIGPTLGAELLRNTLIALTLSFILMVVYISFRFQPEYGWIALLTLFIDTLFVVGVFALKGIFQDTTVDSLFITALLTVIGYAINDTIVMFDRIRENMRFLAKKMSTNEIINASINQTLARSINTSLTTLFTLLALYFFGGATIKDFVLAIILGVAFGSYASIFVAGTLLSIAKEKLEQKKA